MDKMHDTSDHLAGVQRALKNNIDMGQATTHSGRILKLMQ